MEILSRLAHSTFLVLFSSEVDETLGPNLALIPVDVEGVSCSGTPLTLVALGGPGGGGGQESWSVLFVSLIVITSTGGSFRITSDVDDTFSRTGGICLLLLPLTGVL